MSTLQYVTQAGDTLDSLVSEFGTTVGNLVGYNPILGKLTSTSIPAGLIVQVPSVSGGTATSGTSTTTSILGVSMSAELMARFLIFAAAILTGEFLVHHEKTLRKRGRKLSPRLKRIEQRLIKRS